MQQDPEVAKRLVRIGGFVLFLNVPAKSSVGIDMTIYTTGERFQGFKMVPPSIPHLVHWASNEDAVRASLIVSVDPGGAVVFRWNLLKEIMEIAAIISANGESSLPGGISCEDDNEALAFAAAAKRMALDANLGQYPLEHLSHWKRLTSHVTAESIERVRPIGGIIYADADSNFNITLEAALGTEGISEKLIKNKFAKAPPSLHFSSILGCGQKSKPSHRTKYAIDTSFALVRLCRDLLKLGVPENDVANSIIGELQLSFILFLVGQSFSALEQWKRLVDVLCRSEDILIGKFNLGDVENEREHLDASDILAIKISSKSHFFTDAFSIIQSQVSEIPTDTPELTADSFLVKTFSSLSRTLSHSATLKQSLSTEEGVQDIAPIYTSIVSESVRALIVSSRSVLHWDDTDDIDDDKDINSQSGRKNRVNNTSELDELLTQLAEEGGDGDLPEIVMEDN
jgi:A1 cistron-splicing factor AAR2